MRESVSKIKTERLIYSVYLRTLSNVPAAQSNSGGLLFSFEEKK